MQNTLVFYFYQLFVPADSNKDWLEEKSLFPVGGSGNGDVLTNDWCITRVHYLPSYCSSRPKVALLLLALLLEL